MRSSAVPVEGAAGALGAAEGGRAADGLAAHGAVEGDDAVEQRGAAGGGRRGHGVLELGQGFERLLLVGAKIV